MPELLKIYLIAVPLCLIAAAVYAIFSFAVTGSIP